MEFKIPGVGSRKESGKIREIRVEQSGALVFFLWDFSCGIDELKISGPLDGDDIFQLRNYFYNPGHHDDERFVDECSKFVCDMSHSEFEKYFPQKAQLEALHGDLMPSLLDLSDAHIVSGGRAYSTDGYDEDGYVKKLLTSDDTIGKDMFFCLSLKKLVLPKDVYKIEEHGIPYPSYTKITMPQNLKCIGENAFDYYRMEEEITIPSSVTRIESRAFSNCDKLKTIYCKSTKPPIIDRNILRH